MPVIDELYIRNGAKRVPVDSIENKTIEDIVINDQIYHFAKQGDVSGVDNVVCDNAVNEPFRIIEAIGYTTQEQKTSKNLFNAKDTEFTPLNANISTCSKEGDNTFIFTSGKELLGANNHPYFSTDQLSNFNFKPNTTYTSRVTITITAVVENDCQLQGSNTMVASLTYQNGNQYDQSGVGKFRLVNGMSINGTFGEKTVITTFTTPSDLSVFTHVVTRVCRHSEITFKDLMIVEGTYTEDTFPEYEPYGSYPSPEMPSPIVNAGDNGIEVEVKGINIIPYPYTHKSQTINGVTFTINEDRSITATGTATSAATFQIMNVPDSKTITLEAGTYLIIGISGGNSSTYSLRFSNKAEALWDIYSNGFKTLSKEAPLKYIYFSVKAGATVNVTIKPMLCKFDDRRSREYEPYVEPQIVNIPANTFKFGERDRLFKNLNSVKYIQYSPDVWDETKPYQEQWLETPIEHDITDTPLGEQLLGLAANKGTNILEITGASSLGVSYWRQVIPNEEI